MSSRCPIVLVCVMSLTGCGGGGDDAPIDPCADQPLTTGGTVELGLHDTFTPLANGDEVELVNGAQGLWMFIINARVQGMDPGLDDKAILADIRGTNGESVAALGPACRQRPFQLADGGALELTTGFFVPLRASLTPTLDGSMFTIQVEVRDADGHHATDERTVIARMP